MSLEDACNSLVEALDARRTDIVKTLLDHLRKSATSSTPGPSLKSVLSSNCTKHGTLLHYAVHNNLNDAIRALLLAGADPGATNGAGESVLDVVDNPGMNQLFSDEMLRAVAASELDRVKTLIRAGVKDYVFDSVHTKNSALHWAASFGTEDMIKLLVEHGFNINAVNSDGCTPLHDAVQRKDFNIVKLFLDSGADTSVVAVAGKLKGKSPSDMAMKIDKLKPLFPDDPAVNGANHSNNTSINGDDDATAPFNTPVITNGASNMKNVVKQLVNEKLNHLWPRPKHIHELGGEGVTLPPHLQLVVSQSGAGVNVHSLLDVWQVYRQDINDVGHSISVKSISSDHVRAPGDVETGVSSVMVSGQYSLTITSPRIRIIVGDAAGLHYACQTLIQLLWIYKQCPLPQINIRDWPDMKVRAVLVDLAHYGRLPTFETLSSTVKTLAKMKMTELHLFIRLNAGPDWQLSYLPNDLISLDRDCHDRMISIYPTLDILQPCSLPDLASYTPAFSRIVSCFSSRDKLYLGPCLSSVILTSAAQLGPGQVFSSLAGVLAIAPDTSIVMCSNSLVTQHQSLLAELPANIVLMEYGFQSGYPFSSNIATLSVSGVETMVCAGSSSWGCLVGRPGNMISNIVQAAGAPVSGLTVASWSGSPALSPLASSLPGWTLGLGVSWSRDTSLEHVDKYLGDVLTRHVFYDETGSSGQVLLDLGRCESRVELPSGGVSSVSGLQSSLLLSSIMRPDTVDLSNTEPEQVGRVIQESRRCLTRLQVSREGGGGLEEGLVQEITLAGELLLLSARLTRGLLLSDEKSVASLQPTFRTDLANK